MEVSEFLSKIEVERDTTWLEERLDESRETCVDKSDLFAIVVTSVLEDYGLNTLTIASIFGMPIGEIANTFFAIGFLKGSQLSEDRINELEALLRRS